MADPVTAADRLERILYILPAACREGGVAIRELASRLGVDESTILADLAEVTARAYYAPPGSGDDLQIHHDGNRLSVFTTGQFRRPVRLSLREALCLALGLRHVSMGCGAGDGDDAPGANGTYRTGDGDDAPGPDGTGDRDDTPGPYGTGDRDALLRRLTANLASMDPAEAAERLQAPDLGPDPEGIRATVQACARERRRCAITYLKPDQATPEPRTIRPYTLAHAEGHWYVLAWCEASGGVRVFRQDRILDARSEEGRFEVDPDFDPSLYLEDGRVYHHAHPATEAVVRYSPAIARWIRERHPEAENAEDGAVLLRHAVADPRWLVRHVLTYAPEAEVLEPGALRDVVREVAERVG